MGKNFTDWVVCLAFIHLFSKFISFLTKHDANQLNETTLFAFSLFVYPKDTVMCGHRFSQEEFFTALSTGTQDRGTIRPFRKPWLSILPLMLEEHCLGYVSK